MPRIVPIPAIGLPGFVRRQQIDPGVRAAVAVPGDVGGGNAVAFGGIHGKIGLVHADAAFIQNLLEGVIRVRILAQGGAVHPVADHGIGTAPALPGKAHLLARPDRKSTRLNSSHIPLSRMPSSA